MSVVEMPTLYTDQEAAVLLKVSPFTVQRLRRSRKLSYTRVGSKPYVTDRHIAEYLRRQECTATSSSETKTASGTSGSTTTQPDDAESARLALEISQPRKRSSRNTSSNSRNGS